MVDRDTSNIVHYQNLLAVYRKSDGMELGKHSGAREIPNLAATLDVLSTDHKPEKLTALTHLRKHIPLRQPCPTLPVEIVEAVPTTFGLTVLGPLPNRAIASQAKY